MKIQVLSLSLLIVSSAHSYIKMPGEVRRIQSHRAKQVERYATVGLEYEKACPIIDCWIPRIGEGLSLLSHLIDDVSLRNQALTLRTKISSFVPNRLNQGGTIEDLHPLMPILEDIKKYYKELNCIVLDERSQMFVHHFLIELEFAVDLLSNLEYSQLATVQFLNRLNMQNIWIIKKLLDNHYEKVLINQAYHIMCQEKRWPCDSDLLNNTLRVLPEFYDYFDLIHSRISKGQLNARTPLSLLAMFIDHSVQVAKYTQNVFEVIKKG